MDPQLAIEITHKFIELLDSPNSAPNSSKQPDEFKSWAKNEILLLIKKHFLSVDIKAEQKDIRLIFQEVTEFGPLTRYLADPEVTEIMVNGPFEIFVEKNGVLEKTSKKFISERSLLYLIERILRPLGKSVNRETPLADGRLMDGSRINVIVAPLAVKGPNLTIR
jgi:pilus assembly protein CpaF